MERKASVASESAFFDRLARERGRFDPFMESGWQKLAGWFEEAMTYSTGARRLLDVGCGTGESQRVYQAWTDDYTGVDLSIGGLAVARGGNPGARLAAADAGRLPFRDGSFDVVAFSSVLHHIPDFPSAVREVHRLLRPEGRVFAFDPNLLHPAMALLRHPRSPIYCGDGVSPNERPLHPRALRRAFLSAGLTDVRQRCVSAIAYRQVAPRSIDAGIGLFNAFDRLWELSGIGRWFGTFVLTWATRAREVAG